MRVTSTHLVKEQEVYDTKTPQRNYLNYTSANTKKHKQKSILHKLAIFLLTSTGTNAIIFNSGSLNNTIKNVKNCPSLPE